jgi:hypothetical protein
MPVINSGPLSQHGSAAPILSVPIPQYPSDEFGAPSDQVGLRISTIDYGELRPSKGQFDCC